MEGDSREIFSSMMIPEDSPYFADETRRLLFLGLIYVNHLQFSLMTSDKQIDLMESIVLRECEAGEVIYEQGDLSEEFYLILGAPLSDATRSSPMSSPPSSSTSSSRNDPLIELRTREEAKGGEVKNMITATSTSTLHLARDHVFGHEHFLAFRRNEEAEEGEGGEEKGVRQCRNRKQTARALVPTLLAVIHPDQFEKWGSFRLSLIRDFINELEEEKRKSEDWYSDNMSKIVAEIASLEDNHFIHLEKLTQDYIESVERVKEQMSCGGLGLGLEFGV